MSFLLIVVIKAKLVYLLKIDLYNKREALQGGLDDYYYFFFFKRLNR
jgi:hypothetical protein